MRNISAYYFLVAAVVSVVVSKPRIMCGPGTTIKKYQDRFSRPVCVPCPSGTFSKGYNSVCRPCRRCHKNRVKTPCTLTSNTICKHKALLKKSCLMLLENKQAHLMKYCYNTEVSFAGQETKCKSGKCISTKRTTDQKQTTPVPSFTSYELSTYSSAVIEQGLPTASSEKETSASSVQEHGHQWHIYFIIAVEFGLSVILFFMICVTARMMFLLKQRWTIKGDRRLATPCDMESKSSKSIELLNTSEIPELTDSYLVVSNTNHSSVQPSTRSNSNEYFPFPCTDVSGKGEFTSLENETYKTSKFSRVSSGGSDLSCHIQRVDSDVDTVHFEGEFHTTNTCIVRAMPVSPTSTCSTTPSSVMPLDTVVPLCKESMLKPKHFVSKDVQKPVSQSVEDEESQDDIMQGRHSLICDINYDIGISDCVYGEVWSDNQVSVSQDETKDGVVLKKATSVTEVTDEKLESEWKPKTASLESTLVEVRDLSSRGKSRIVVPDSLTSEQLNNWHYNRSITGGDSGGLFREDMLFIPVFDNVFVTNSDNTSDRISDSASGSIRTSASDSISSCQSSETLSSSSIKSTSPEPEPVTYLQIQNRYSVKNTNVTANTPGETQIANTRHASELALETERCIAINQISQLCKTQENDQHLHQTRKESRCTETDTDLVASVKEDGYAKTQVCKPENLHETMYKSKTTQTRYNQENMPTLFGQKWDVIKYISAKGGLLTKATTNMSLTVFEHCVPRGETVLVGGRFTGNYVDVLPYLDSGWVITSPLAEFQMTFRNRWERYVKIYIPYYQHHPKETMKVFFYHRTEMGDIERGDVPLYDETQNQDMYYVKKADHVEIYTLTFTLFHCACDHKFTLNLTSLIFTSYIRSQAVVRVYIGSRLLGDPLNVHELQNELKQICPNMTMAPERGVRLLQKFDGDSRLVFKIDLVTEFPGATHWKNMLPLLFPEQQERRLKELVSCQRSSTSEHTSTPPAVSQNQDHSCPKHMYLEWRYVYDTTQGSPPEEFMCTITITHELPQGQEAERHGRCQEGITPIFLETSRSDATSTAKEVATGFKDHLLDSNAYSVGFSNLHNDT